MNEEPTIEERVKLLEVAVIQLQEAFNNLVALAVRTKEEEEEKPPMRASVGHRGPARCKNEDSTNNGHLCIWGFNLPTKLDCHECIG